MGIFLRQSHNVKPPLWGSPADRQYAIWDNLEKIYGVDHESEVLIMPLFWGLPPMDYSKFGNHGTNHGATYKDGSLDFDGNNAYISLSGITLADDIAWSISMWVYPEDNTIYNGFYGNAYTAGQRTRMMYYGTEAFRIYNDADVTLQFFDEPPLNQLSLMTIVCNGADSSNILSYRDGDWKETGTLADSSQTIKMIGGLGSVSNNLYNGTIPETRIAKAAHTADQIALFHDNKYGLYQKVSRPIWSIPAAPPVGAIMNQFQGVNLGADLFNGTLL